MPPIIDEEKCIKCEICIVADQCQSDVFYGSENGKVPKVTYPDECWHCNACVLDCPAKAVSLFFPHSFQLLLDPEFEELK